MTTLAVTSVSSLRCQAYHLLSHRLRVPLHAVDSNRDAVDQRERLRVFRKLSGKHACDSVSELGGCEDRTPRSQPPDRLGKNTPFGAGTCLGRHHTIVAEELSDARDLFKPVMND